MQYLTESLLGEFLNETYSSKWIHDKQFVEGRVRPERNPKGIYR